MQVRRCMYLPAIGVQKCKTTRYVTFKSVNINRFKQSALFIKYSTFDNQLWVPVESGSKTTGDTIISNLGSSM